MCFFFSLLGSTMATNAMKFSAQLTKSLSELTKCRSRSVHPAASNSSCASAAATTAAGVALSQGRVRRREKFSIQAKNAQ